MDTQPTKPEVEALLLQSAKARQHLGFAVEQIRIKIDVPARLQKSMLDHPTYWLAGATASSLFVSRWLFRKAPAKPNNPSRSWILLILKLAANAAMPAVKIWLLNQLKSAIAKRSAKPPIDPMP